MPTITEIDVVRAWKDEAYYESLSDTEKALLPPNPAGKFNPNLDLRPLTTKTPAMCWIVSCIISATP